MEYEAEIDHLNECSKYPVPCPNGCNVKNVPRENVSEAFMYATTTRSSWGLFIKNCILIISVKALKVSAVLKFNVKVKVKLELFIKSSFGCFHGSHILDVYM